MDSITHKITKDKKSIWRHIAILTGGTLFSRILVTVASPILSRLYTPADFGMLSIFTSILGFMITISALNYETAIPLPEEDNAAFNLAGLAFGILLIVSMMTVVFLFFYGQQVGTFFNEVNLGLYVWLIPISLIAAGTFVILNNCAIRFKAFTSLAKRQLSQTVFQIITQVGFPFFLSGPLGLLVGDAVGRSCGSAMLIREMVPHVQSQKHKISISNMILVGKRYHVFPTLGLISVVLHSGFTFLPPLFIAKYYGLREAGLFSLVSLCFAAALSIVGLSMAQVYMGHASRYALDSPTKMKTLFFKISNAAFIGGLIPFGLVLVFGPLLFEIVFGDAWIEAGVYSQLMALPALILFIVGPVYPTLRILKRQDLQMWADLFGIIVMVVGMAYVHSTGLSSRWIVVIYGVSIVVTYGLFYIFSLRIIEKKCKDRR